MKLKTTHEQLFHCLDYVISVVPAARIDPILSHVLLRAEGDRITMIATNHEVQMTVSCEGETGKKIERIVPADKLRRALATFSGDTVITMDFADEEVKITANHSVFKLKTKDTEMFTLLGETSEMETLETMACDAFHHALSMVQYASAEESHRRSLNGILLQRLDDGIHFVGTDGHRMATIGIAAQCASATSHIVPIKTAHILAKHIGSEGEIEIAANDRVIRFRGDRFELISNVIQDTYPDYQHVIPRANENQAILEREALRKSLDRVMALSNSSAVAYLEFGDGKLNVSANNTDNDSLDESLEIKYTGEKMKVVINAVYLVQFLGACKTQMVEINMSTPESSILMRPIEEQAQIDYVVMPVRV